MVNLQRVAVPADGDCLYHAVIKGLYLTQVQPRELRKVVANVIRFDQDLYDDLVTEWKDFSLKNLKNMTPEKAARRIENTKEWATSTVIHILSLAMNCRINVFEMVNGKYVMERFPSEWKSFKRLSTDVEIFLHKSGGHFELLVPEVLSPQKSVLKKKEENIVKNSFATRSFNRLCKHKSMRTPVHIYIGFSVLVLFISMFWRSRDS